MPRLRFTLAALALAAVFPSSPVRAQFQAPLIALPDASQAASATQRIGVTDIEIRYHRPGVNDRVIWGGLVPYGEVWRAGANQNTTIAFSTPVTIEGKPLAAGTYGLHMIPTASRWTIAFSTMHDAWGSFTYDHAEDALRVEVQPVAAPFEERLAYRFDEPTADSAVVAMTWEKLRVPFQVKVDVNATVLADVRRQMRGLQQFSWRNWNDAARIVLRMGGSVDEAMAAVEKSIKAQRNYTNLSTKAAILDQKGDAAAATALRSEAETIATEAERNTAGYQLFGAGDVDGAIAVFERNAKLFPESWNAHDSLAEALARKGDKARAIASYERAAKLVTDPVQKARIAAAIAALR